MKLLKPLLYVASAFLVCSDAVGKGREAAVEKRVGERLKQELALDGLKLGSPVFIRVFKEEKELELFVKDSKSGKFKLFRKYTICSYSGNLGPKLKQGDRQAPEGFYYVPRSAMNPFSRYHLSFNIGYPNAFDRHHKRTGSLIMVHGNCVSIGCFAMKDGPIEEIYTIANKALKNGQKYFRVHSFPFRMTEARMKKASDSKWYSFWKNLKTGYDHFEKHKSPPNVNVKNGKYVFESK